MSKKELGERLARAREREEGARLSPAEVVELLDSMASMAALIQRINQGGVAIRLPPDVMADAIMQSMLVDLPPVHMEIEHQTTGYLIRSFDGQCQAEAETALETIDIWRIAHGQSPLEGIRIELPGSTIVEQVSAGLTA